MPYKSEKQRNFFRACAHNPDAMKLTCPPRSAIAKFEAHEPKPATPKKRGRPRKR